MKKIFALLFPSLTAGLASFGSGKRTVDGALVHFNKAIAELKAVKAHNDKEADKHHVASIKAEDTYADAIRKAEEQRQSAVQAAEDGKAAAEAEALRAARLAAKLEALVA